MEFLRLLSRRHFTWKPGAALQNVGCFFRLDSLELDLTLKNLFIIFRWRRYILTWTSSYQENVDLETTLILVCISYQSLIKWNILERKWDKYRNKPLYGYFWQNGSRQSPLMKGQSKSLKQWSHCYLWKLVHFQVSQWGGKETFQTLCCPIWYVRISPEKPMIWWKMWECERIDVCRHPNRGLEIVHSNNQLVILLSWKL